jgi:uncharacterized membrane protein YozB (DUF420 family)
VGVGEFFGAVGWVVCRLEDGDAVVDAVLLFFFFSPPTHHSANETYSLSCSSSLVLLFLFLFFLDHLEDARSIFLYSFSYNSVYFLLFFFHGFLSLSHASFISLHLTRFFFSPSPDPRTTGDPSFIHVHSDYASFLVPLLFPFIHNRTLTLATEYSLY